MKRTLESLDYDPEEAIPALPLGFRRSKTTAGLNLTSGGTDTFHFFWNHLSNALDWWRL